MHRTHNQGPEPRDGDPDRRRQPPETADRPAPPRKGGSESLADVLFDAAPKDLAGTSGHAVRGVASGRTSAAQAQAREMDLSALIIGPANRLAFRAAERVAERPGGEVNPLTIVGPLGSGKTHLAFGLAQRLRERRPEARVIYTAAEEFSQELFRAIQERKTVELRERYRRADALVFDDLDVLATRKKVQEELVHTMEALHHGQRQIVVCASAPPSRIDGLLPTLTGRFAAGMVVHIDAPDKEMRRAIVERAASRRGVRLSSEVMEFIATDVGRGARDLLVAVTRLEAHGRVGVRLDVDFARAQLRDLIVARTEGPIEETILRVTAETCGVPIEEVRGRSQRKPATRARQIAIYLARKLTPLSLADLGRILDREASTVTHAEKAVGSKLAEDPELHALVEACRKRIEGRRA